MIPAIQSCDVGNTGQPKVPGSIHQPKNIGSAGPAPLLPDVRTVATHQPGDAGNRASESPAGDDIDARDKEAKAAMSLENAQANFHRFDAEERAHEPAMIEASEADRALREVLATHNVQGHGERDGVAGTRSPAPYCSAEPDHKD